MNTINNKLDTYSTTTYLNNTFNDKINNNSPFISKSLLSEEINKVTFVSQLKKNHISQQRRSNSLNNLTPIGLLSPIYSKIEEKKNKDISIYSKGQDENNEFNKTKTNKSNEIPLIKTVDENRLSTFPLLLVNKNKTNDSFQFKLAQDVMAKCRGSKEFYPGTIIDIKKNHFYVVMFDDGDIDYHVPSWNIDNKEIDNLTNGSDDNNNNINQNISNYFELSHNNDNDGTNRIDSINRKYPNSSQQNDSIASATINTPVVTNELIELLNSIHNNRLNRVESNKSNNVMNKNDHDHVNKYNSESDISISSSVDQIIVDTNIENTNHLNELNNNVYNNDVNFILTNHLLNNEKQDINKSFFNSKKQTLLFPIGNKIEENITLHQEKVDSNVLTNKNLININNTFEKPILESGDSFKEREKTRTVSSVSTSSFFDNSSDETIDKSFKSNENNSILNKLNSSKKKLNLSTNSIEQMNTNLINNATSFRKTTGKVTPSNDRMYSELNNKKKRLHIGTKVSIIGEKNQINNVNKRININEIKGTLCNIKKYYSSQRILEENYDILCDDEKVGFKLNITSDKIQIIPNKEDLEEQKRIIEKKKDSKKLVDIYVGAKVFVLIPKQLNKIKSMSSEDTIYTMDYNEIERVPGTIRRKNIDGNNYLLYENGDTIATHFDVTLDKRNEIIRKVPLSNLELNNNVADEMKRITNLSSIDDYYFKTQQDIRKNESSKTLPIIYRANTMDNFLVTPTGMKVYIGDRILVNYRKDFVRKAGILTKISLDKINCSVQFDNGEIDNNIQIEQILLYIKDTFKNDINTEINQEEFNRNEYIDKKEEEEKMVLEQLALSSFTKTIEIHKNYIVKALHPRTNRYETGAIVLEETMADTYTIQFLDGTICYQVSIYQLEIDFLLTNKHFQEIQKQKNIQRPKRPLKYSIEQNILAYSLRYKRYCTGKILTDNTNIQHFDSNKNLYCISFDYGEMYANVPYDWITVIHDLTVLEENQQLFVNYPIEDTNININNKLNNNNNINKIISYSIGQRVRARYQYSIKYYGGYIKDKNEILINDDINKKTIYYTILYDSGEIQDKVLPSHIYLCEAFDPIYVPEDATKDFICFNITGEDPKVQNNNNNKLKQSLSDRNIDNINNNNKNNKDTILNLIPRLRRSISNIETKDNKKSKKFDKNDTKCCISRFSISPLLRQFSQYFKKKRVSIGENEKKKLPI